MTTNAHTDITVGAPANAAVINAPLGQLDLAITNTGVNMLWAKYRAIGTWDPVLGTGDAQGAINQAIIDATAAGGSGTVFFPAGTYLHSASINLSSNLTMLGASYGVSLLKKTASSAIVGTGLTNIRIAGLLIDDNNQGFNAIQLTNCTNCILEENLFRNLSSTSDAVVLNGTSSTNTVRNNWFITVAGTGGGVNINGTASNNAVLNNSFNGIGSATHSQIGIGVGTTGCNGNLIQGNTCLANPAGYGISLGTGANTGNIISGNYSANHLISGIICNGDYNSIQGNTCVSNTLDGIDMGNANGCIISGNYCYLNAGHGIEINSFTAISKHNIISNNVCRNNANGGGAYDGICIQATTAVACNGHIVVGNRCFDDRGGGAKQNYGIEERANGANVDNNFIVGNDVFLGNTLGTVKVTGPSTRAVSNFGSGLDNHSVQSIAYAATITPDASAGELIIVGTLTGAMTINAPTNPSKGQFLTFLFTQDGSGNRLITFNAAAFKGNVQTTQFANLITSYTWFYDGAVWQLYSNGINADSNGNAYLNGQLNVNSTITSANSLISQKDRRISKQAPAFAASPAPDPTAGEIYAMAALTGAVTVANPINAAQGQRLLFIWTQDGTGGRTVTYSGANWRSVGIAAQTTTLSTVTIDEAVCVDGTIWRVNRLVTGQTI